MSLPSMDEDALVAAADLIGRSGARNFEIGYDEDPPHTWWAHAQYRGARLIEENHPDPVAAAEALARRVLTSAKCAHCGGLVALSDHGAVIFPGGPLIDGSPGWTEESARAARQCRWTRMGDRWVRGCEGDTPVGEQFRPSRAARRAHKRRRRP